ncbi:hypothetical protein HNR02_002861 [Amycolatopsis endophytica]|uniref:Uncharacterized protein n=1 Tax=Amycolatopsis endophytica TaxID=860233 RepID=A0A853B337_9PSEU|nr:hypothetical protein [Amycolatopsis endophytica]NYI89538.1 hypothetical protein [Amycolatopsis endophytica]
MPPAAGDLREPDVGTARVQNLNEHHVASMDYLAQARRIGNLAASLETSR